MKTVAMLTRLKFKARSWSLRHSSIPEGVKVVTPLERFRRLANIVRFLVALCRTSYESLESQKAQLMSVTQKTEELVENGLGQGDLVFNPAYFKADKKMASISQEARRVLQKPAAGRTSEDHTYLGLSLRNLPAFAAYPQHMQQRFCQVGWYETYEARRTIIRQGHPPLAFYFILAGTVVVTVQDTEANVARTACFLHRGEEFGEIALVTRSRRQGTVISKTAVELLVISVRDFQDIFMSGGIRSLKAPEHASFIRNLDFMKGWPVDKLSENSSECMFPYFSPGQVVVRDSNTSEWIYIVKSGSISVLKKLRDVKPTNRAVERKRPKLPVRKKPILSHDSGLRLPKMFKSNYELERKLEETLPGFLNHHDRLGILDYDTIEKEFRSRLIPRKAPVRPVLPKIPAREPVVIPDEVEQAADDVARTPSSRRLPQIRKSSKGVYLSTVTVDRESPRVTPPIIAEVDKNTDVDDVTDAESTERAVQTVMDHNTAHVEASRRDSLSTPRLKSRRASTPETMDLQGKLQVSSILEPPKRRKSLHPVSHPVFIHVQMLEKGQYFGLRELVFSDQPSTSLVSNGAECIMLSKTFFLQHLPEDGLRMIKEKEVPLPMDDELQHKLQESVNWRAHCARTYRHLASSLDDRKRRRRQYASQYMSQYDFRSGPLNNV